MTTTLSLEPRPSAPHTPVPVQVPTLRALRGATTVEVDDRSQLTDAVRELLDALVAANGIARHDIVSAIFTTTSDLRSLHPAAVARAMGWHDVPMLCVAEMEVEGALPRCVRVMLHVAVRDQRALRAAYLREARALRPDLVDAED